MEVNTLRNLNPGLWLVLLCFDDKTFLPFVDKVGRSVWCPEGGQKAGEDFWNPKDDVEEACMSNAMMVNSFKAKNIDILTEFPPLIIFLQKCSKAKSGKNDITSKFQTGQYILLDLSILWPGHKCEGVGVRTGHWPNQPPQIWDAFESPTATGSHRFQTKIQEKDKLKIKVLKISVLRRKSTLFSYR